jgi:hypothetical protein
LKIEVMMFLPRNDTGRGVPTFTETIRLPECAIPLSLYMDVLLEPLERVTDEPDRGWPQTYEQGSPLGVAPLFLIDGLASDPEGYAQSHRTKREDVKMPASKATLVHPPGQHAG